jgi:uncharacterized Zn finger protein (UPF0148 family)
VTQNCGRCGKPLYKPGAFICDSCRKVLSKDKTRHARRMEDRVNQEKSLYENITRPGGNEESEDLNYEHYLDTHDATAVWVDRDDKKGRRKR